MFFLLKGPTQRVVIIAFRKMFDRSQKLAGFFFCLFFFLVEEIVGRSLFRFFRGGNFVGSGCVTPPLAAFPFPPFSAYAS